MCSLIAERKEEKTSKNGDEPLLVNQRKKVEFINIWRLGEGGVQV